MAKSKHPDVQKHPIRSQESNQVITQQSIQAHFSGPLPPPDVMESYKRIYPASIEIIFEHFRNEQNHRHELEKRQLEANIEIIREEQNLYRRAQNFAFVIGLIALLCGITATALGNTVVGSIIGGGGVAGLVGTFLYTSKQNQKEGSNNPS
ncbi:MAG: DUF2335 domain-containing protein [SAR324 cluster bacterium]|nr:DUF2335 domain-containing protein [SAR324 cluster bacterium]